ncbi:VOC family protein [Lacticaseibacillus kribbianus]|uniref:VOC family protein n=1 Tax=Lacticaseibacillus kribbianus TaxID=2926292 RepID=UPI001CD43366|nr:VOC family protein [Lacticaseibacillus kribbianus]
MPTAVLNHICLQTKDITATVAFFTGLFDARVVHEWGTVGTGDHAVILNVGPGVTFEIFEDHSNHAPHGIWDHVAFTTQDIHETFEKAQALGARVVVAPAFSDIPTFAGGMVYMWYGYLQSPAGEVFELIQEADHDESRD